MFVDGPSLLHHIAVSTVYDCSPPVKQPHIRQRGFVYQASPSRIYTRITNFMRALLNVLGSQGSVHVVMDGLAPTAKIPTQVSRMKSMAQQGEAKMRCKLPHLLAESSMVEALEDLSCEDSRVSLHQPDHGEAETYINGWIRSHGASIPNICIFSDDTDFLVYPSCPGFIPLKTLEFQILDGQLCLTGFHYSRSKFVNAFFSIEENDTMTAVAALAGCDYGMSESMARARTYMVQSDIGGLRRRHRNDPSAAAALTAILRFVSHYGKRGSNSWLNALVEAVCKDPQERIHLTKFFQEIHGIYFYCEESLVHSSSMSVEGRRLWECGILFCRPLIETWNVGTSSNKAKAAAPHRKRARNSGKNRRKKRREAIYQQDKVESLDNPPMEITVPFPPSHDFVNDCRAAGSVWSVFDQVRRRLYAAMYLQAGSQQDVHLHPAWICSNPAVSEYIRTGRGSHVDFVEKTIAVSKVKPTDAMTTSIDLIDLVLGSTFGVGHAADTTDMKSIMEQHGQLFVASLMLPAKSALLLILLGKAPPYPAIYSDHEQEENLADSLQESLLLMSVAWFHASLAENVLCACSVEEVSIGGMAQEQRINVSHVFRHDLATWIWCQLCDDRIFGDAEDECTSSCNLDTFFQQIELSTKERLGWDSSTFQAWHKNAEHMWKTWLLLSNTETTTS